MGMLTRGEDIDTLAMVREVGPLITQGRGANSNGLLGGGGREGAGVPVVVAGSDGEMHARIDSPVDSIVQSEGLATTQRHVGHGTLVLGLSGRGILSLGSSELVGSLFSSPQNTANNIGHSTTSVGTQNLDSNQIDSLGNAELARTNGTGAVGSVTVSVIVDVILRDGLSPRGTSLKFDMLDVDTGIDDVDIDALATARVVFIESESSETEPVAV